MNKSAGGNSLMSRLAERTCAWSERWVPDAFAVIALVVVLISIVALGIGVPPLKIARSFGDGFWSLIPFTMQMTFIVIGGYIVADSPPIEKLTHRLASIPRTARGGVVLVAMFSMVLSLLHWGMSLVLASLLARALARRTELRVDYRAVGAAAYLGIGSVWALGLSSSAAQLQANPTSMPPSMLAITGVLPFEKTIFLWQSMLLAGVLIAVSAWTAWVSAPDASRTRTAEDLGLDVRVRQQLALVRSRPGEWLEFSPVLTLAIVALGLVWLADRLLRDGVSLTISNLNNYNLIFLIVGLLLHWRPRNFLDSAARSISSVAGVLIQFPILGAISMIMTSATTANGQTLAGLMSDGFSRFASGPAFAFVVGLYSAALGWLIPSGGGKWVIEAPYVMRAANDLQYHLGWTVQIYNAAEALPNLINPFWMLPVLGILGLKARHLIGFTFIQFIVNMPIVLFLLWILGTTLTYEPPVMP